MPAKQWTDEERKAFGDKMRAIRAAKLAEKPLEQKPQSVPPVEATPPAPAATPEVEPEMEIVGAALNVPDSNIKSMLESINEDSEVEIYNPLDQGFRVQFATSAYQSPSLTANDREVRDKALLPHEKDGGQSFGHAIKTTVLPPHKVTRLPGKVAHVAVKQLRNYLIAAEGKKKSMADPVTQRTYEERIITRISSSLDNMTPIDPGTEIDKKIAELNPTNG